jgi:hypothetical protein
MFRLGCAQRVFIPLKKKLDEISAAGKQLDEGQQHVLAAVNLLLQSLSYAPTEHRLHVVHFAASVAMFQGLLKVCYCCSPGRHEAALSDATARSRISWKTLATSCGGLTFSRLSFATVGVAPARVPRLDV